MFYKGIIFDLDGTLVNSLEDIADSMNNVLLNNQFPIHTLTDYKSFIGNGILNLVRVSLPLPAQDEKTIKVCYSQMIEMYSQNCVTKTKPYDGILDMLNELKARKMNLGVLSNKADELTKQIVHELMPDYFEVIIGLTDEKFKKPNPYMAHKISSDWGIDPELMLFVGDTSTDMKTAQNANMWGVGVTWGFRTQTELFDNGANIIINHPSDLIIHLTSNRKEHKKRAFGYNR